MHLIGESMSISMIILLGIFVWAPLMAYLGWKYFQTFTPRATKRRPRRPMIAGDDKNLIPDDSRRRIYRRN